MRRLGAIALFVSLPWQVNGGANAGRGGGSKMTFTYDPRRRAAVDAQSGAVVYRSPRMLDAGLLCLFVYEKDGFRVEFEVLPVDEPYRYRWKGMERTGQFTARMYVIEPRLRRNFIEASRSQTGTTPDDDSYRKFRDTIVEAMVVRINGEKASMLENPDYEIPAIPGVEVRFVQRYNELPEDRVR